MSRFRKIILLIISVFMLGTVLASCGDGKVKVGSIAFRKDSIEILIDQTIEPEIVFTPTYATNRKYTLSTTDKSIIKIEGTKIVALSSGAATLKVVSVSDNSKSATVAVRVYPQPITLPTPTNLHFSGTHIAFDSMVYANNIPVTDYQLKINDEIFNLGSVTSFAGFEKNVLNTVFVRAVGEQPATLNSEWSTGIKFIKIGNAANIRVVNKVLTYDAIDNVGSYEVKLTLPDQSIKTFKIGSNGMDLSMHIVNAGEYLVSVKPLFENYDLSGFDNLYINQVFSGEVSPNIKFSKLATPTDFVVDNNRLEWSYIQSQCTYSVRIYDGLEYDETFENITNNYFELPQSLTAGNYMAALTANGIGAYDSDPSTLVQFQKLEKPTITIENNKISWGIINGATKYVVYINETEMEVDDGQEYSLPQNYAAGDYKVEVQAFGPSDRKIKSDITAFDDRQTIKKLDVATLLVVNNMELTWLAVADSVGYDIYVGDTKVNETLLTTNSFTLGKELFATGLNVLTIKSLGNGLDIFDSKLSAPCNITLLAKVGNVAITNGAVNYGAVTGAIEYFVQIFHDDSEFITSGAPTAINLNALTSGEYYLTITAKGDGGAIIDGDESALCSFKKLAVPTINILGNVLSWTDLSTGGATGYKLSTTAATTTTENLLTNTKTISDSLAVGTYAYKVKAVGNNSNILDSDQSGEIAVEKLAGAYNLTFDPDNLTLQFESDNDTQKVLGYQLINNSDGQPIIVLDNDVYEYQFDSEFFEGGTSYGFGIKVLAATAAVDNVYILNSNVTATSSISVKKLGKISNFKIEQNILKFNSSGNEKAILIINGSETIELTSTTGNYQYNITTDSEELFTAAILYNLNVRLLSANSTEISGDLLLAAQQINITKLAAPASLTHEGDRIIFPEVAQATGYKILISGQYLKLESITPQDGIFTLDIHSTYVNIPPFGAMPIGALPAGTYSFAVLAMGNYLSTIDSSPTASDTVEKLNTPTVYIEDSVIKFNAVTNAESYLLVFMDENEEIVKEPFYQEELFYDINTDTELQGEITVLVKACGDSTKFSSDFSTAIKFIRETDPELRVENGVLKWSGQASQYLLKVGTNSYIKNKNEQFDFDEFGEIYDIEWQPTLQALATEYKNTPDAQGRYHVNSRTITKEVTKLGTPELTTIEGRFSFVVDPKANTYILQLINENGTVETEILNYTAADAGVRQYVILNSAFAGKNDRATLRASYVVEDGEDEGDSDYINSNAYEIRVSMLQSPGDVRLEGGDIKWTAVNNASAYYISIYNKNDQGVPFWDKIYGPTFNNQLRFPVPTETEFWKSGVYEITILVMGSIGVDILGDDVHYTVSKTNVITKIDKLDDITTLQSKEGILQWTALEKASSYMIKIFEYEFDGVNYTPHFLEELSVTVPVFKFDDLDPTYMGLYGISIRAIGNESNLIVSSEESEIMAFYRTNNVQDIYLEDGLLNFNLDSLASGVKFVFERIATGERYTFTFASVQSEEIVYQNIDSEFGSYQRYNILPTFANYTFDQELKMPAGKYHLSIVTLGNSARAGTIDDINSGLSTVNSIFRTIELYGEADLNDIKQYIKLPTPVITYSAKGVMTWSITGESYVTETPPKYLVKIKDPKGNVRSYITSDDTIDFNENSMTIFELNLMDYFTIDFFAEGSYFVSVQLLVDGDEPYKYITSAVSAEKSMSILVSPSLKQELGSLKWYASDFVNTYKLTVKISQDDDNPEIVTLDGTVLTYELDDSFAPGEYYINIQAMSDQDDFGFIDSKGTEWKRKVKMDINMGLTANFTTDKGELKWSPVIAESYEANIYEIRVNGETFYITIRNPLTLTITDPNIKIDDNGYICYEMPDRFNETDFVAGNYTISIKALGNDVYILSSGYSDSVAVVKHAIVENLRLENGDVTWTRVQAGKITGYYLNVSFTVDSQIKSYTVYIPQPSITNPKYTLPEKSPEIDDIIYDLTGREYTFKVKIMGSNEYLNSSYSPTETHTRLPDLVNINTVQGVLTWGANTNAQYFLVYYTHQGSGTQYTIKVSANLGYIDLFDEDIDSGKFEIVSGTFAGFKAGIYTIQIKSVGTNAATGEHAYITSRTSVIKPFTKLSPPPKASIDVDDEDYTKFIWLPVNYASQYEIEVGEYGEDEQIINLYVDIVEDNYYSIEGTGEYRFRIRAITSTSLMSNSEFSDYVYITKPQMVDLETLILNESLYRFEWDKLDRITKYEIRYSFRPATSTSGSSYGNPENRKQFIEVAEGDTKVYFEFLEIGIYGNVMVYAITDQHVASDPVQWTQLGETTYTFALFDSGAGTAENSYKIKTAQQFVNISVFPSSYYEQIANISLADYGLINIGSLSKPFAGYYDGKGYEMTGINDTTDTLNKSIFGVINGATIKNIVIPNATIVLSTTSANTINLAIIAYNSIDSLIDNVQIGNLNIEVAATSNTNGINIAGLISEAVNTTIQNSDVKVSAKMSVEVYNGSNLNFAGIVATINGGSILSCKTEINYTTSNFIAGRTTLVAGIASLATSVNIDKVESYALINRVNYAAGIVAKNNSGSIINRAYSYGIINILGISSSISYAGGISAYTDGTIKNSYSLININIDNSVQNAIIYAALLAGYNNGSITNCFAYYSESYELQPVGKITATGTAGEYHAYAILGGGGTINLSNCYISNNLEGSSGGIGTKLTSAQMLNVSSDNYFVDLLNTNAGETIFSHLHDYLPILIWEHI